jgi:3-hydroxyisobutyrate dehydrogenase-like beta-hydroxyacid dehydrogenase
MRLGFIGAGNMATALARGIAEPALVYDIDSEKAQALAAGKRRARIPSWPSAQTPSCYATSPSSSTRWPWR